MTRVSRVLIVVAVALAASLLPTRRSAALDLGEYVRGLQVSPFLSERVEYETNVFQVPSRSQDDVVFKTIPGFLVEYGAGPHWVSLGYRAEILKWLRLNNQDATHHILLAQLHLEFNRLRFDLKENFVHTTDPPGTELTGRIESDTNSLLPNVEYRLTDRFSVGANAEWIHVRFPTIPELDRDEYLGGVSVFWKFLPKTDLGLNYNYGQKVFDSDATRDVRRHVVLLRLRGELTPRITSTLRIGYEDRQPTHDNPGIVGYRGLVGGGDVVYRPTDRTTLTLLTDRSVQESIFENALYYVSTTGTLVLAHQFTPKLTVSGRVTGGQNDYPVKAPVDPNNPAGLNKFRKDTIVGWGASAFYDIQRWLRVGLDFLHLERDSNIPFFSFKDDKIAGSVTLQF